MNIDFETLIPKFDKILERGLCVGIGSPDSQMCIEAAITQAMDLPFGDEPACVEPAVREFKITLNDSTKWASVQSRAKALRDIGIAQIGSKGVVSGAEFSERLLEKTIRVLIPTLFREIFKDEECLAAANICELEGTRLSAAKAAATAAAAATYAAAAAKAAAAYAADTAATAAAAYSAAGAADAKAVYAAAAAAAKAVYTATYSAADAAAYAAYDAAYSAYDAAYAAAAAAKAADTAAAYAADNAYTVEKYLILSANLALEVLWELKSPGCEWINWGKK